MNRQIALVITVEIAAMSGGLLGLAWATPEGNGPLLGMSAIAFFAGLFLTSIRSKSDIWDGET